MDIQKCHLRGNITSIAHPERPVRIDALTINVVIISPSPIVGKPMDSISNDAIQKSEVINRYLISAYEDVRQLIVCFHTVGTTAKMLLS